MDLLAEARDIALDLHIVGRVRQHAVCLFALEERIVCCCFERTAAFDPVIAAQPEVAGARHRFACWHIDLILISVVIAAVRIEQNDILVLKGEAGSSEIDIKVDQFGKLDA